MNAQQIINLLKMEKYPGGGYFKEVHLSSDLVDPPKRFGGSLIACSTIYYLLESTESKQWHQLKQDEIWFYHAGQPASIKIKDSNGEITKIIGNQILVPEAQFQVVMPAMKAFSASLIEKDSFILVSCVTAPGFANGDSLDISS